MAQYGLFRHYTPEEMRNGPGTMAGNAQVEAESDEAAVAHFRREYGIASEDLSVNWRVENKKYSVVKLCPPG